jgi:hypothetical protein
MNQGDNNNGAVAGSFTLAAQLPNGKSLTFSGYVLQAESLTDVNTKLDMAVAVVERQRLHAEIPELEAKLEQHLRAKRQSEAIIKEVSGKDRPTSQDKQMLNTHRVNITMLDEEIKRGSEAIEKARLQFAA